MDKKMFRDSKTSCVVALFLLSLVFLDCIGYSWNAALTHQEVKRYKHLIEGQGLYSTEDDVAILMANNFKNHVYNKPYANFVEFYNSWCGFCQRFAPSWKALASDVKGWRDIISIAAIDCSDEDNQPICRDFEIMAYPTLRYFHENYEEGPGKIGTDVQKGEDVATHKIQLIKKIIQEQAEGRGKQFPNIAPYSEPDLSHLYDGVPLHTKFVFLILEGSEPLFGPEIAFDLRTVPNVVIKYALANNTELAKKLGIKKTPRMVVMSDDNQSQLFSDGLHTRESMRMAIKDFLRPKEIFVPEVTTQSNIFTGKWIDVEVPDMSELMEAREKEALKRKIKGMGDVVFQADLETALRSSLKTEVALRKTITGEKLEALKNYLDVLVKYFPFGRQGQLFLADLKRRVENSGGSVEGADVARWVAEAERDEAQVFSSQPQWLACAGSSKSYRGYPCGLWKLFHYLTVNAAERNAGGGENANPREVLDAMLGYIKNFFGCADCSRHFQEMAEEKDMKSVSSYESAVLWLWMAHNAANKRLAGDATEDPEFPKIQYPSPERCPTCRNSDRSFNLPEVLRYLKHVYSSINVKYVGSDTRILHLGLDGGGGGGGVGINGSSGGGSGPINGSSGYFFHGIDASMCCILYVGSFLLIIILIRMFLKRGYKKKMYVHDLLGKV